MRKFCLHPLAGGCYLSCVAPQRVTGFSSLNNETGSRLFSDMRFFCSRNPASVRIMAGRSGEAFAPAGSFIASLLTLLRLATPFSSVVTRLLNFNEGAFIMADSARLYLWRFFSCQTRKYHTVTACTEKEARARLPDAPCLFAARIAIQEVRHA